MFAIAPAKEEALGNFEGDGKDQRNAEQAAKQGQRKRYEPESAGKWQIGQGNGDNADEHRRLEEQPARPALPACGSGAHDQHGCKLRDQRFHEPAGAKLIDGRPDEEHQETEGQEIEERADRAEAEHEALDSSDIPSLRAQHVGMFDAVRGYCHGGYVGQKIVEQDLLGEQRQEGQE